MRTARMNRRTFNKLAGLGVLGSLSPHEKIAAPQEPTSKAMANIPPRKVDWPFTTYRRFLVDTHVPDWDSLLANFDAADYVSTIARAGFQSLMQYANSHVGLFSRGTLSVAHQARRGSSGHAWTRLLR